MLLTLAASFAALAADPAANVTHEVLEHHGNSARSGLFVVPGLTWEAAGHLRIAGAFHADVAGPVYAQPLYWHAAGDNSARVFVATEQNLAYALDARTGAVVWKTSLGPPVPRSSLSCGNINPLGITGTPVIDVRQGAVYLDGMVLDKASGLPRHRIFGLSLQDGTVLSGWPVDVESTLKEQGKLFRSADQNQRGALTIVGDTVYVPYGGHFGDCGNYRGWVLSVSLQAPHAVRSWSTRARGGGIWSSGGVSSDGDAVYVATGNTLGAKEWGDGEAVIRLSLNLSFSGQARDFFVPSDWQQLDSYDADLGGTNPLLLKLPSGSLSELVLALGKDGNAYLLDRQNLGGMGRSLLTTRVASEAIRSSPAYFDAQDAAFAAFQARGAACPRGTSGDLTVIRVAADPRPSVSTAWCAAENGRGTPIVTTTDGRNNPIVWAVGAEGSNRLRGFRGDTGAVVFAGGGRAEAMTEVRRFQSPIVVDGHVYVAADEHVYAFAF